jgi:hypothetical protein
MHSTAIRHIQTQNGTRRRELLPELKPAIRDEVAGAKATLRAAKFGDSALSSWADMSDRAVMKNLFENNILAVEVKQGGLLETHANIFQPARWLKKLCASRRRRRGRGRRREEEGGGGTQVNSVPVTQRVDSQGVLALLPLSQVAFSPPKFGCVCHISCLCVCTMHIKPC